MPSPTRFLCCALALALFGSGPARAGAGGETERPAWDELVELEQESFRLMEQDVERARHRYLEVAALYLRWGSDERRKGDAFWRAARCYWMAGEMLPVERREERHTFYKTAAELASRGVEKQPDCAECMLWNFIALGRVATTSSLIVGMRSAPRMAELLDRAIALNPQHRDGENNSTLGNLHYGSAIFYRVLPDWVWLGWVLGVRGDKERALEHARTALALHPKRLDYRVELGSQLLCSGTADDRTDRLEEGARALESVLAGESRSIRDERQMTAAKIMLETPEKSCGFTGDEWVEIDERMAVSAATPGS